MPKNIIIQELEQRIARLRSAEDQAYTNESERICIQSRRLELESVKNFIHELAAGQTNSQDYTTTNEFWRLIDEF